VVSKLYNHINISPKNMQVTRLAKLGTGQTTLSISEGANMMLACFRKLSGVGISDFEGM